MTLFGTQEKAYGGYLTLSSLQETIRGSLMAEKRRWRLRTRKGERARKGRKAGKKEGNVERMVGNEIQDTW